MRKSYSINTNIYIYIYIYLPPTTTFILNNFNIKLFMWWRGVIRESLYKWHHTFVVQLELCCGMILFIVSEIMSFLAFFGFFYSSLAPTVEIGAIWFPKGIDVLNSWGIPFLNTLILLSSRAAVTWVHHAILASSKKQINYTLVATR